MTSATESILPDDPDQDAVFVERFVDTNDPVLACVQAGISDNRFPIQVVAERQLARAEIKAAIAALQKIRASSKASVEITRESVLADMQNVYEKALADREYNSAIAAKKLQAALAGWLTATLNINHRHTVDDLGTAELMRIASQGRVIDGDYEEVPQQRKGLTAYKDAAQ